MTTNDQFLLEKRLEEDRLTVAPELSQSEYFEIFCAEQVLKDVQPTVEEVQAGIVDGTNDGGIDAIYVVANGQIADTDTNFRALGTPLKIQIHVIQAKHSARFQQAAVLKVKQTLSEILHLTADLDDLSDHLNELVLDRASLVRSAIEDTLRSSPDISISVWFCSLAVELATNTQSHLESIEQEVGRLFSNIRTSAHFQGAPELMARTRTLPTTTLSMTAATAPVTTDRRGFVCLVKLSDLYEFITDDDGALRLDLLESNVRHFMGRTPVNQSIESTLAGSTGDNFWWLNNGVTILCSAVRSDYPQLTMTDPQIVNGLQTCWSIHDYFSRDPQRLEHEERHVLIRAIDPGDEASYSRIIRATNNQNSIPSASLRSTEKVHRDIEDYFLRFNLYYDRRKNFYKNHGKPRSQIVGIVTLAQAVASTLLRQPDYARARPSSLINHETSYDRIFSESYPLNIYLTSILLLQEVERYLLDTRRLAKNIVRDLKFHVLTVVTILATRKEEPGVQDIADLTIDRVATGYMSDACDIVLKEVKRIESADETPRALDQIAKTPQLAVATIAEARRKIG